MARLRLGVALLVPPPVSYEVDGLRRALGDAAVDKIPAHLTLVPPVNVPERSLEEAHAAVRAAASSTPPLRVQLGPPATFWPDNPVVYLSVAGDLDLLYALRDTVFAGPWARSLSWPFVPHVTLLDGADPSSVEHVLESIAAYHARVTFERVHVLQESAGRTWRPVADTHFGGSAVIGRGGLPVELSVSEHPDLLAAAWAREEWAHHDRARLADRWSTEETFAITARREGEVVGLAEGAVRGEECHLARLIVERASRGQGVGSKLTSAVESLAAGRGCRVCRLRTEAGGRGEAFYRGHGWVVRDRLEEWRNGQDFVRMERRIS